MLTKALPCSGGGSQSITVTDNYSLSTSTPFTFNDDYAIVVIDFYETNIVNYARFNGNVIGTYYSFGSGRQFVLENVKKNDVFSTTAGGWYCAINCIK